MSLLPTSVITSTFKQQLSLTWNITASAIFVSCLLSGNPARLAWYASNAAALTTSLIIRFAVEPCSALNPQVHCWVQVSCVSGAQLSNYATFLVHPEQAALSIVLTALSTAAGVVLTPLLVLLLLGQHIPVDVQGMAVSIMQIVIAPVGLGICSTGCISTSCSCAVPQ